MACPFFYPLERFDDKAWSKHPRLPLGDPYVGLCRVNPMRDWRPDEPTLRELCNFGYARQRCPRFPKGNGPDALRFSIIRDRDSLVEVFYVSECDHSPLEHGKLEYSTRQGRFLDGHANELVQRQAQAYVDSYLRRKLQPEDTAKNPHRR